MVAKKGKKKEKDMKRVRGRNTRNNTEQVGRNLFFFIATGRRLDVHGTKHPESCIHIQSGEYMGEISFERDGGNLSQNLVHDAILVDIGPGLGGQSYQQEVECGVEPGHGWSV